MDSVIFPGRFLALWTRKLAPCMRTLYRPILVAVELFETCRSVYWDATGDGTRRMAFAAVLLRTACA